MIFLGGILVLWNAVMLIVADMVYGRVLRTLFPLTNEERLEGYRFPLSRKEFWIRTSVFWMLYLGVNIVLIILLIRGLA